MVYKFTTTTNNLLPNLTAIIAVIISTVTNVKYMFVCMYICTYVFVCACKIIVCHIRVPIYIHVFLIHLCMLVEMYFSLWLLKLYKLWGVAVLKSCMYVYTIVYTYIYIYTHIPTYIINLFVKVWWLK